MAKPKIITLVSCIFLTIGGFLFGYDSGIISSTISQPHFINYFESPSDKVAGAIVSSFTGGATLGSLFISYFNDKFGRKMSVFVGSAIATFGCALQAGAVTIAMLIAGRAIAGFAVGQLTATIPMHCAEIASSKYRGAMSGLLQWMLSWGFFAAQWIGYGSTFHNNAFQWRFPLAFQCVPSLALAIGIWFIAESPRWLMENDRQEEARAVLQKLHGGDGNAELVELEFREIYDAVIAEQTHTVKSWSAIISKPSWRKRLLLGAGVQAFGQLSGVNVINYYGPRIYASLGIDNTTALMIIGISGSLSIIYATIGLAVLDRIGRVKPLIFSATGCGLALVVNAALSQHLDESNQNQLRAMVAMNFVFSLFFTMTGIVSWVYPAEIFPLTIRARGNSLSTFTNWSLNLLFAQISPICFADIGFKYFYVFFVCNVVAAVCYIFFYPETKGRTLEQLDELFGDQLVPHALKDPENVASTGEKASALKVISINKL
ncbi:general substrate transporter [Zopfia rhizophila CBS 207.26]|uniref:General substrate transporter n=1 Tax=Zopfia rhizophila CBS 207.26 TaxID=1314779 RepID=A0A6A6EVV7_9PEZI|nr:general substrate transporter [Zopfia rhizophila CBS 207.26]